MRKGSPASSVAATIAVGLAFAPSALAASSDAEGAGVGPSPEPAEIKLELVRPGHGKLIVNKEARMAGRMRPFVPGQKVRLALVRSGKVVKRDTKTVRQIADRNVGRFHFVSERLVKPGRYAFRATHEPSEELGRASDHTRDFRLRYPDVGPGAPGGLVELFHDLLHRKGYANAPGGRGVTAATGRAVLAFRKVNGMRRTMNPTPGIFRTLAAGKGGFRLHYPGAGKHVEVDISRQVMVLANRRRPQYTYHVSTGAPATPTIRGKFRFYWRQPGYNDVRMYYSVYFRGGYAIHGYDPVPTHPASHGCIRNPIPDSRFIYNWVELGMPIYVFG